MTSLESVIRTAIAHGVTLCSINGHIDHWLLTCRNKDGEHPGSEEFKAEFERQMGERVDGGIL